MKRGSDRAYFTLLYSNDLTLLLNTNKYEGVSRSASVVISYLMFKRMFKSYQASLEHVKSRRSVVEPNTGFVKQLLQFERMLNSFEMSNKMTHF